MLVELLLLLLIDPIESFAHDTFIGSIFSMTDGMVSDIPPDSEWAASLWVYDFMKWVVYFLVSLFGLLGYLVLIKGVVNRFLNLFR